MNARSYSARVLLSAVLAFALHGASTVPALGAVTLFGQTFYSTNTGLSQSGGEVVWQTLAGANSEMHTNFAPITLAIGEKFTLSLGLKFSEPQTDGGNGAIDGIRMALIDLTTQTNADGAHAATTGEGYRFRFNWETTTDIQGGVAHERTGTGSNANYLTSSGGIWDQNALNFNGFGLNADGTTSYPVLFSVERTSATDALVTLSINGVARTYTDTGDGAFSYDTFVLSKIGDAAPFTEAATFTINSFSTSVVPEPSAALLLLAGIGAGAGRRRSRAAAGA